MVKIHLSNQDLLAQKSTFFLFLKEKIYCGYSLEASRVPTTYCVYSNICPRGVVIHFC